jgi:hypothetical protein
MRRTIVQFVAVVLTAILAIAGCCGACPSDTAQKKPANTSAQDCHGSKDKSNKEIPQQQHGNCPQCLENRYSSPEVEHSLPLVPTALTLPAHDTVTLLPAIAPLIETHTPPLISGSTLYLRLSTLLI